MRSRAWFAIAAVALVSSSCGNDDKPGAYFLISSDVRYDQVELFFGGQFPTCGGGLTSHAAPVTATRNWPQNTDAPNLDRMYRRQTGETDTDAVISKSGPPYTTLYHVLDDTDVSSPPVTSPPGAGSDSLGAAVVVVATLNQQPVAVGELDYFVVPSDSAHEYMIQLDAPGSNELELWGPDGVTPPPCVRYTRNTGAGSASTFVVSSLDRDCDGFLDSTCQSPGPAILDDCNPLAFCGSDASGGVAPGCLGAVVGGCLAPMTTGSGRMDDQCEPGLCSNTPGSATMDCAASPGFEQGSAYYCLAPFECACTTIETCRAIGCDRSVLECATAAAVPAPNISAGNSSATWRCTFEVDPTTGIMCASGSNTTAVPLESNATTCPTVLAQSPTDPTAVSGVTFQVTSGLFGCALDMKRVSGGSAAGFLPITNILLLDQPFPATINSAIIQVVPDATHSCPAVGSGSCSPMGQDAVCTELSLR